MSLKLAFSGGGFRATFFCLGAYRRLVELGIADEVSSISSVSGGSITAGAIMLGLSSGKFQSVEDFDQRVTGPLQRLGQSNLRQKIMRRSIIPRTTELASHFKPELPRTRFSRLYPKLLDESLFQGKKIKDLPSYPEWSCNATCLNTLKRFRFKVTDMYAGLLGQSKEIDDITVAFAVAASAAFPMMFAPLKLSGKGRTFVDEYCAAHAKVSPDLLYLTDGGVYDNLGSESILKDDTPYIILDASAAEKSWGLKDRPSYLKLNSRLLSVSLDQIVNLRRRLIFTHKQGIQMILGRSINKIRNAEQEHRPSLIDLPEYPSHYEEIEGLIGGLRTDLDAFHDVEIASLMWSGAIHTDLAVKAVAPEIVPAQKWNDVPVYPFSDNISEATEILKRGQKRSNFSPLHTKLSL
ncbi:patatin-like phospholipase family protein [Paenibacillus sp. MMS18-CY102]|uniref:patatin-like phospholipase family protein n=1 Tax=Paenibacillus sp. MMS18-CY102 TaxID=2682849 RepID=UPI00136536DE|nr:patatin-like phospholipase family protein [Paenibacillus sp. MMS18-CY102]MWC29306.1 patatin-like phospholipase family protein [Paenibacillus sp. MMS18-CY102]